MMPMAALAGLVGATLFTRWRFDLIAAFAVLSIGLFGLGVAQTIWDTTSITLTVARPDAQYNDTYYVIAHGWYVAQTGAVFAVVTGLLALNARFGLRPARRIIEFFAWALVIGGTGNLVVDLYFRIFRMPRRYVDYPDWAIPFQTATALFVLLAWLGLGALLILLVRSFLPYLTRRRT